MFIRYAERPDRSMKLNFSFFCSDLTLTFVLSLERLNYSSTLFTQYFQDHASIHLNLIVHNSTSSFLQFDLWLPFNRARLRVHLMEFPYQTPLFIHLIYRSSSSSSLTVFLFGQMMDSTTNLISLPTDQTLSQSSLLLKTFVPFQSISWSYEQTPSGRYLLDSRPKIFPFSLVECCAYSHNKTRLKRDSSNLETCQCKCS